MSLDYYFLIPEAEGPGLLIVETENGWTLPHLVLHGEGRDPRYAQAINQQLAQEFPGLAVTVLHYEYFNQRDPASNDLRTIFAMDNLNRDWQPTNKTRGTHWIREEELDILALSVTEHRSVIQNWFEDTKTNYLPAHRQPWQQRGWFKQTKNWIETQFQNQNIAMVGPLEQINPKYGACIMTVQTTIGKVYFKAVHSMFAREAPLTLFLATHHPEQFVRVLAIDTERHWLLAGSGGDQLLFHVAEIKVWQTALRQYAQLQIDMVSQTDTLQELGCPDASLSVLERQLDQMLADHEVLMVGQPDGLSQAQVDKLLALASDFKTDFERLATFNLPMTLEHGDFHLGNILVADDGVKFIDWTDATISHPFFSLTRFLTYATGYLNSKAWASHPFQTIPDLLTRLRDAYLQPWTRYETLERLVAAYELSKPLALLQHALNLYQLEFTKTGAVLGQTGARWERFTGVPYFLKLLLEQQQGG